MKTASQIALDKHLISNLSQEDIKSISYTAGYEHFLNEKNEMTAVKNKTKENINNTATQ